MYVCVHSCVDTRCQVSSSLPCSPLSYVIVVINTFTIILWCWGLDLGPRTCLANVPLLDFPAPDWVFETSVLLNLRLCTHWADQPSSPRHRPVCSFPVLGLPHTSTAGFSSYFTFMCRGVLPACMYVYAPTYMFGAHRDQKTALNALELVFQMVMNHHICVGNQIWIFRQSNRHFKPLSHSSSSPYWAFFGGAGDSNFDPHVCTMNTLLIEPSPQPHVRATCEKCFQGPAGWLSRSLCSCPVL